MADITITSIRQQYYRVRVVRRQHKYYWPFWKKRLDKYRYYKRPVGETSLKIVEVLYDAGFTTIGFVPPGEGRYPPAACA